MKIIRQTNNKFGNFSTLLEIPPAKRVISVNCGRYLLKFRQSFDSGKIQTNLYLSFPCLRFYVHSIKMSNGNFYWHSLKVYIYSNEEYYLLPLPNIDESGYVCMKQHHESDNLESFLNNSVSSFFDSQFNFESFGAILYGYKFKPKGYFEFLKKWVEATKDGIGLDKIIELKTIPDEL